MSTHGDLKKIAACKVKPYELVNSDKETHTTKEVMKEDGLEDINSLYTINLNNYYHSNKHTNEHFNTIEEKTHNVEYTGTLGNTTHNTETHAKQLEENMSAYKTLEDDTNTQNSTEEAHTLKAPRYISFTDTCIYTVELPISEHWRPKVKVAKKAEVKNLQDYETFMEVKDKGQTKVGS